MIDQLLSSLKEQAVPELINKLGLDQRQADGSVNAAASSVQEAISGGDGFGLDDVMNLFSDKANTAGADGLLNNIGGLLKGKLTNEVGLGADKAGSVADMLLPMVTQLVTKHLGGDAKGLQGMLGNLGGGKIGGMAKGLLGNLFK